MIPKIIHLCWLSGDKYPELIAKCLESWTQNLSDYEIKIWDSKTFNLDTCNWTKQAFALEKYAAASDYIRFYVLYNFGGIYLDSDVEVVKSFDELLDNSYFIGYEYTGMPEAAVIGAEKGLEWIKNCKEWYENKNYYDYVELSKNIVAPLIVQYGFEKKYLVKLIDKDEIIKIDGGNIYPYEYFSPQNGFTGRIIDSERTFTIHHFNSAWLTDKLTMKIKMKRNVHKLIIKIFGKKFYNHLFYIIRKNIHEVA